MKVFSKLLIIAFIIFTIIGCDKYTQFRAKIVNDSSSEITQIDLGMIGVEDRVSIKSLAVGVSTEYYTFLLKKLKEGEPVPISYGDYNGRYNQKGETKSIFIPTPSKKITIKINDYSFTVE